MKLNTLRGTKEQMGLIIVQPKFRQVFGTSAFAKERWFDHELDPPRGSTTHLLTRQNLAAPPSLFLQYSPSRESLRRESGIAVEKSFLRHAWSFTFGFGSFTATSRKKYQEPITQTSGCQRTDHETPLGWLFKLQSHQNQVASFSHAQPTLVSSL